MPSVLLLLLIADVVAGEDRRVILGMVWILISKFAIEDISEEQATAKVSRTHLTLFLNFHCQIP